jgi:hypothetical protein
MQMWNGNLFKKIQNRICAETFRSWFVNVRQCLSLFYYHYYPCHHTIKTDTMRFKFSWKFISLISVPTTLQQLSAAHECLKMRRINFFSESKLIRHNYSHQNHLDISFVDSGHRTASNGHQLIGSLSSSVLAISRIRAPIKHIRW